DLARRPQQLAGRPAADRCIRDRRGGRLLPLAGDHFAPDGQSLDQVDLDTDANAPTGRYRDRSSTLQYEGRLDDVLGPVAVAGGDVTGQSEIRQGRQRDVTGAADAGLEHAAAPDGQPRIRSDVMDAARLGEATDLPELDIDHLARAQLHGLACITGRLDALIEADRGAQLSLERRMIDEVAAGQGLFQHQQPEAVELRQVGGV